MMDVIIFVPETNESVYQLALILLTIKLKPTFAADIVYGGSSRTYHSNIIHFLLSQAKENVVLFSQVK